MRRVAILIFDDVEVLDFCGPLEVFSVAAQQTEPAAFEVFTVAETAEKVACRSGLVALPTFDLQQCPEPDILLVPGGVGTRKLLTNQPMLDWISQTAAQAELVLSVCSGALLLGKLGLLDGLEATTHHQVLDLLQEIAPGIAVLHNDRRYVDNGKIITSAGIAAGLDMSLHVVGRLLGTNVAKATAAHMEYPLAQIP